jgi:hypothetical protein
VQRIALQWSRVCAIVAAFSSIALHCADTVVYRNSAGDEDEGSEDSVAPILEISPDVRALRRK